MKLLLAVVSFFIFTGFVYTQDNNATQKNTDDPELIDSVEVSNAALSINELKQILFSPQIYNPYTDYLSRQKNLFSMPYSPESEYTSTSLHLNNSLNSFDIGKKNLMYAISLQPKFLSANELGVLGQILLYANVAACGYALYEHLRKYKDEY